MATLIADRFLRLAERRTIDLATGEIVAVRISPAAHRIEQQAWTEACAVSLGVPQARTLIDFGLIGSRERFEAFRIARPGARPSDIANIAIPRHAISQTQAAGHAQAVSQTVEWLDEASGCSARILYVRGGRHGWVEQLAREIRLRGFMPLSVSVLTKGGVMLRPNCLRLCSGRAVALLDECHRNGEDAALSSAFITVTAANARELAGIVHVPSIGEEPCLQTEFARELPASLSGKRGLIARAAESRSAYGDRHRVALVTDSRATNLFEESRRLAGRGRHAAAERSLRAAIAAFDRRKDLLHAGEASLMLGRLVLERGRAPEAQSLFEGARERFQNVGSVEPAVRACVFAGLAETDNGALQAAERTLRGAYSAASALQAAEAVCFAGIALARSLYWQERYGEALALLEQIACGEEGSVRYWCLTSRLWLATGRPDSASQCVARARNLDDPTDLASEADIRLAHARIQAKLGDIDALSLHVRAGLAAARSAHRPLLGVKLRLALTEGLLNAGLAARARAAVSRTRMMGKAGLPRLLKLDVDRIAERLSQGGSGPRPRGPAPGVRETAPAFLTGQLDRVTELLSLCHDVEDERAALNRAALAVRKQTGALATGIFGAIETETTLLGHAGAMPVSVARRSIDLTCPVPPQRGSSGFEAAAPIRHLGRTIGAIACRWTVEGPQGVEEVLGFMRLAAAACAPIVQILLARDALRPEQTEIDGVELVGSSSGIQEVRRLVARAANAPFTVLIEGESGSGKELVARAIHRAGCRRERPFCALNCAALTEELVDAELFGHVKGAFTGATSDRLGLFESAGQGTVFLDEIGELSARAQPKLLRVLQEGEIRRVGETFTRPIDARLVAATNRPLREEAEAGRFRQDLLYRLDVIRIQVPPLRERVEDIPLLAARFWRTAADRIGSKAVLGQGAVSALARYDWPGNVRELQNVLAALAVAVPSRGVVSAAAMPAAIGRATSQGGLAVRKTLDAARRQFEERFVRAALAESAGHRGQTAAALGVSRQGLAKLMQRLQI
jgi:DNA-binding NtrC family response regulator/tetratricopeptide (TPR) repeat protein